MNKLERDFQAALVKELEDRFPGCIVLVKPGYYVQGFPDLLVLHKNRWAALECKRKRPTRDDDWEPNQQWWLSELDGIGFASVIYPENRKEILDEIQRAFRSG